MYEALSDFDLNCLRRAVRLAMAGRGHVEPNPMVGCIILNGGKVIGEGYHARFGGPHAEAVALAHCKSSPAGSTVYLTLEPCCHLNKKTPPCVPKLIEAGVARVVVGASDPNPMVGGRGIEQLRQAGIAVDEANDPCCRALIAPFLARISHKRPYVTLKWAQSADGKLAGSAGVRMQISNERSHRVVHELRARSDAILVGIGTVRADNPLLTVRGVESHRPLLRVVLDSDLRLSVDSQLVRTIEQAKLVVFCSKEAASYSGTRVPLAARGVEVTPVSSIAPGQLDLAQVLENLGSRNITHLLVEPGPGLARGFIGQELWDRTWVFRSPINVGEPAAPTAPDLARNAVCTGKVDLEGDALSEYLNPAAIYAGPYPSADLIRVAPTTECCPTVIVE